MVVLLLPLLLLLVGIVRVATMTEEGSTGVSYSVMAGGMVVQVDTTAGTSSSSSYDSENEVVAAME